MALKSQKTKKRTKQGQKQKTKQNISYSFQHETVKISNSSSHTVINRQEDVIIETVFIEGLTKKFFFSLISNNKLFWCGLILSIFICSSISVACTLSCGKAPVNQ